MILEINEQEREILLEVLKTEHKLLLDELHHTENYDFKQVLKQKDETLKNLRLRVEQLSSEGATV